jgi:sec-independent protein translocase protein TatC
MSTISEDHDATGLLHALGSHLEELRRRLIVCMIALLLAAGAFFWFSDTVVSFLTLRTLAPSGTVLHFFDISEPFTFRMKLSIIGGLLVVSPFIVFQLLRFVLPALSKDEKRLILPLTIFATALFYTGAALSFHFALPQSITMLLSFAPKGMQSTINADNYLSFIAVFILFGGIIFEMPVISFALARTGIIGPATLGRIRKYAIVVIWIVAAVMTPPDVISQIMAGIPMMLLYEISVLIARLASPHR